MTWDPKHGPFLPGLAPLCACWKESWESGEPPLTTTPSHRLDPPALGRSSESAPLRAGCRVSKEAVGTWWALNTGPAWGRRGPRQATSLPFQAEERLAGCPISDPHLLGLHCSVAGPDRQTGSWLPQCRPQLCLWIPLTAPREMEVRTGRDPCWLLAPLPTTSTRPGEASARYACPWDGCTALPLLPAQVLAGRR